MMVRFWRDASDQVHRLVGLGHAHAGGGLVEAEQLGLGGQCDGDLEIALLAVREVGPQFVFLVAEAHRLEHRAGPLDDIAVGAMVAEEAPGVMAGLDGDAHVLEDGRPGQDVGDLVRAGDGLARDAVGSQPGDVLAVEDDAPSRRAEHSGEAVEEGRLAGAVGPDDGPDLATGHGHAHVVESAQPAELHAEALGAENGPLLGAPGIVGLGHRARGGHGWNLSERRVTPRGAWGAPGAPHSRSE